MTSVASVTSSTPSASSVPNDLLSATQDRFLKLLVAQMNNQDPLNPLDNTEVTSQMAQLSTVSGINKLTDLMSDFTGSFAQSQSLQAATMIGRGVFVPGQEMVLSGGSALAAVDLPQSVESVNVFVKDASGQVIHSATLGAQPQGMLTLQWDGVTDQGTVAPSGTYKFEVQATSGGKQVSDLKPLAFGYVNSVTLGSAGVTLNLNGIGGVAMSEVQQIL